MYNDFTNAKVINSKAFDAGLRAYMLKVYNYMCVALAITAVFSYASLSFAPLTSMLFKVDAMGRLAGLSGFGMLVSFAPIMLVLFLGFRLNNISTPSAQMIFWAYAALMGMSLASLGLVYTGASLTRTLLITSSVFAAMSLYGYTTKRDLTAYGSLFTMAIFGLIIASIANMFLQSNAMYFATSVIGVLVFTGLVAYSTQEIKSHYYIAGGGEAGEKLAIMGALRLYINFINLFIYLLRFFGDRRSN